MEKKEHRERMSGIARVFRAAAGALALAAVLVTGGIQAQAAPAVMSDGQVFDAAYYAAQNPDVVAVFGTKEEDLYKHYTTYGQKEGRMPWDPSLTAEELLSEVQQETARRAKEALKKNAPKEYDAAQSIRAYLGDVSDETVQAMIDTVDTLTPMAAASYVTYTFPNGKTFILGPELAMSLMKTGEDGTYVVENGAYVPDEAKVRNFVTTLESRYGVKGSSSKFTATDGRQVSLSGGFTNKSVPDVDAEVKFLVSALTSGKAQSRTPAMKGSSTYVEVDIKNQKAYYYKNGKQLIATDIVTGNAARGMNTPTGVYRLLNKVRDTYLTGANYSSHVDYWMPFIGNSIGLHDADWRYSFGGSIYKTSGSHGCVNMPKSAAKQFFEQVSVGTPVIVIN